ncbi:MAG: ABC-F family ATP-binding cassette domain-containing protein [Lachnospiraceae bacterium]|nr:ABC-F family ATP-binding cassette domain-containing protein [Lachnospiraceae bacterium]
MAQISVKNLTFGYEGSFDYIFEEVSFSIDTNWKLGFIGRNGKGKTTFLNLLMGKYTYRGSITTCTVFDYFPYRIREAQMQLPAVEFVEELKTGCEIWRVICELEKLEEDAEILYRPFGTLSPGERTKVLLAVLFSGENDFLLVDEPTNHLDKEAREVVKRYLASKKGFILVSHDRDLLDACIDHCLVLNRGTIEVQSSNFSTWWENKQRKDQFAVSENEKHQKEIKKLKQAATRTSQWADKNEHTKIGFDPVKEHDRFMDTRAFIGAKTKKMQSRVKQMEKRISREIEEKEGLLQDLETPVDLKLVQLSHHKNRLVNIKEYGLTYVDAGGPVFQGLSLTIHKGERLALSGKNGCGKSTLIKRILQQAHGENLLSQMIEEGVCETAAGLVISYVGQDTTGLSGNISDFCKDHNLDKSLFCTILRQLDFERTQFLKNMEDYSEGQKKKILLAASLLTPAHLYIWDEPLNYIDVFSRMQVEKLLLEYQPTMLFVEHDVRFCEKIATGFVEL